MAYFFCELIYWTCKSWCIQIHSLGQALRLHILKDSLVDGVHRSKEAGQGSPNLISFTEPYTMSVWNCKVLFKEEEITVWESSTCHPTPLQPLWEHRPAPNPGHMFRKNDWSRHWNKQLACRREWRTVLLRQVCTSLLNKIKTESNICCL